MLWRQKKKNLSLKSLEKSLISVLRVSFYPIILMRISFVLSQHFYSYNAFEMVYFFNMNQSYLL